MQDGQDTKNKLNCGYLRDSGNLKPRCLGRGANLCGMPKKEGGFIFLCVCGGGGEVS